MVFMGALCQSSCLPYVVIVAVITLYVLDDSFSSSSGAVVSPQTPIPD